MGSSFADAFVKAGVISQQHVDDIAKKEEEVIKAKKDQEEKIQQQQDLEYAEKSRKDLADIQPFIDMWNVESKQKFLIHLLHSFTPLNMGYIAWTEKELKQKTCCICKQSLMSKEIMFSKIGELSEVGIRHLHQQVQGTLTEEQMKQDLNAITNGKTFGIVSEQSTAAFCCCCYDNFSKWVFNSLLCGNTQINRIIHKRMEQVRFTEKIKKTIENLKEDIGLEQTKMEIIDDRFAERDDQEILGQN